jgi:hypothetical protein
MYVLRKVVVSDTVVLTGWYLVRGIGIDVMDFTIQEFIDRRIVVFRMFPLYKGFLKVLKMFPHKDFTGMQVMVFETFPFEGLLTG